MAQFELVLPKMGESVAEATIIKWIKQPGDSIAADDTVLEIATDKVDSEVPSPIAGKLVRQLFGEDEIAQVGDVIAIIETEGDAQPKREQEVPEEVIVIPEPVPGTELLGADINAGAPLKDSPGRFYSPLVKSIASNENISIEELEAIPGSGADGRVTKDDLMAYLERKRGAKQYEKPAPVFVAQPAVSAVGSDEIIEMDRMRRLIAEHMVMSKRVSPHVCSFVEADVTNMVLWRDKVKEAFEKREQQKITFTPLFIEAIAKAIRDFPMINVSVEGTQIIKKRDINIGMAAALPNGNLIVPVIKNADQYNLIGLTKSVNDLALRARNSKLKPDETQNGTFTFTNIGSFGNIMGMPIINQPQVAILAVGTIKKKPAVLETEQGDVIAIRHMMFLSLSYDHRVVDGALGGSFVRRVADYLENWDINRKI